MTSPMHGQMIPASDGASMLLSGAAQKCTMSRLLWVMLRSSISKALHLVACSMKAPWTLHEVRPLLLAVAIGGVG
eukprot:2488486-Pyramimonas_sp.AAC.2